MKIKHISIKDFIVRVTKKGKTRGRPSKHELNASALLSYELKKNDKAIKKVMNDVMLYGKGIFEVRP